MPRYLLNIHQPDGPPPEDLGEIMADLTALNEEMTAAGVWVFGGGLLPPAASTVVKASGREVLATDGPYTEAKEFIGGFTVIDADDLDTALVWAGKLATVLSPLSIEVRPFAGA
ncbi:YciI family protein [Amycolatopsis sp. cg5]|uniref:YciI family protein n=1 Tax=Amycolatopsis sp. cg5 TaxID=3238802 RepID=UPI003523D0B1